MTDGIKYNGEHRLNVEEKKARGGDGLRGRGGMSRGGLQVSDLLFLINKLKYNEVYHLKSEFNINFF